jgi:hypothetical protein
MQGDGWAGLVQWPAMVASVAAAWLVASDRENRRNWGFWCFLLSNALWMAWGWHDRAWALVALQVCLAAMNVRGVRKNQSES